MTSQSQPVRPIVPHAVALAIIAAVVVLGLVFVLFVAPVGGRPESYACGRGVGTGFVLWGVLAALVLRRSGRWMNVLALVALCGLLGFGSLAAARRENLRATATVNAIQDDLQRFAGEMQNTDPAAPASDAARPRPSPSNDPWNEYQRFASMAFERVTQMRRDYLAALAAIGWNEILSATRLESDTEYAESKARIVKARALIDRFEEQSKQVVAEIRASIDTLNIPEPHREAARSNFDGARARSAGRDSEIWQLERQVLSEIEGMVALLESGSGWRAEDGKIAFFDEGELAAFNRRMTRIEQIVARQEWLQKQAINEARNAFESMKPPIR